MVKRIREKVAERAEEIKKALNFVILVTLAPIVLPVVFLQLFRISIKSGETIAFSAKVATAGSLVSLVSFKIL
jgi:hypothetical protein